MLFLVPKTCKSVVARWVIWSVFGTNVKKLITRDQKTRERVAHLEAECDTLRTFLDSANEKISQLSAIRESLAVSLASEKHQVELATAARERVAVSRAELALKVIVLESTRNELELSLMEAKRVIVRLNDEYVKKSRALEDARHEVSRLRNEHQVLSTRFKAAVKDAVNGNELKATVNAFEGDIEKAESKVAELNMDLFTCSKQLSDAKQARAAAEAKTAALTVMFNEAQKDLSEARSQVQVLAARHDELSVSVQSLEKAKASLEANLAMLSMECATTRRSSRIKGNNLVITHAMVRCSLDEISSLRQQLEEKDAQSSIIVHDHLAEVRNLDGSLLDAQDHIDAQATALQEAEEHLQAERLRAEGATSRLVAVQRELCERTERHLLAREDWRRLDAMTTHMIVSDKRATANLDAQLKKTEAERDVFEAQAKQAPSALSGAQSASPKPDKQTEALIASLWRRLLEAEAEKDRFACGMRDALAKLDESKASVRVLERRGAELTKRLDDERKAHTEKKAQPQAVLDASRDASTRTLIGDLSNEVDTICALKEAVKAYANAIEDCDAFYGQVQMGR